MFRERPQIIHAFVLLVVLLAIYFGVHQTLQAPIESVMMTLVDGAHDAGLTLTSERRQAGDTAWPMAAATVALLALVASGFWLLRRTPGRRFMSRTAYLLPALLLVLGINTLGYGAGVVLPALLVALGLPTVLLFAGRKTALGHALLIYGTVVGLAYLTTSGIAVAFRGDGVSQLRFQAHHSQVGLLWVPFLLAWTWSHVLRTDGIREDRVRWSGFLALGVLAFTALTGFATLFMFGDSTLAKGAVHGWVSVAAWALILWHSLLRPSVSRPGWMAPLVAGGLVLGAGLGVGRAWLADPVPPPDRLSALPTRYTLPQSGVHDSPLQPGWLGSPSETVGCAGYLACHPAQGAAWEKSAHGHSAGSIYAAVAAELVRERGKEAVALCAACHDPMPLLSGALTGGSPAAGSPETGGLIDRGAYPQSSPEHVACGICHGTVGVPEPLGAGSFQVRGDPEFQTIGQDRSTAYLLVKSHIKTHRRDWTPEILGSDAQCGSCHQLVLRDLPLVTTHEEWRGFVASDAERRSCVDCHMPRMKGHGDPEHEDRDHRALSGNISLARLSPAEREERRRFLADAISLAVEKAEYSAMGGLSLALRLRNETDGHGFPTQPLDLTVYFFEARLDGGEWQPLHTGSIFEKILLDENGKPLTGHQLWKTASTRGGGRIAPGQSRSWEFTLPESRASELEVRLMHQRLRDNFITAAMREEGLMLDPVVVLTASVAVPSAG